MCTVIGKKNVTARLFKSRIFSVCVRSEGGLCRSVTGTINPITGHVDADDAVLYRAIGLDRPDPPSIGGTDRTTHVPFGWIRPWTGGMPKPRRYIYGGPPAGPFGPLGGGLPGGGPPGRGLPGGGPPMPIPPAPVIGGGRNDKLVGNTPLIFKGERS
jgi:hypothetical protein